MKKTVTYTYANPAPYLRTDLGKKPFRWNGKLQDRLFKVTIEEVPKTARGK